jgi:ABC-type thiamin/hydroxymethylpyrimidine transport system permease subunit
MSIYIAIMIAGFGGGMVRGLVGFLKNQYSYKTSTFNLPYFLVMSFLSGIIGLLTSMAISRAELQGINSITPAIAFIVGYAGGDFLENIWKVIAGKAK